jgi:tetratricopeptide (TPR) repeat protein
VFWVPAISQESFELAYREIGIRLRIPGIADDNADVKKLVQETLSSESVDDWLMIVDNADDREVLLSTTNSGSKPTRISDYLPRNDRGAILFTTRSRKVAGVLTPGSVLKLNGMSKGEARQLLTQRITEQTLCGGEMAVDELLELLTCLPLAIVQAAAFMSTNDVSLPGYLALFRDAGAQAELFDEGFADPSRYAELDSTIAKTWHISFDQMRKQDPLAAKYLSFMACIDRASIPQSLLPRGASVVQQTKALGTLTGYAFITERSQTARESDRDRLFDMHRLVHMASACWLDAHGQHAVWLTAAVARLKELVPYGGHKNKEAWTTYLSHAVHAAGMHGIEDQKASASLLDRVGRCQASLGQYAASEATHRQVLSVRKAALGPEHPETLTSMSHIGTALSHQGKYAEAEKVHRETLGLHKDVLGKKHQDTITSMNNVAQALNNQGKFVEAESIHRETLDLSKKVLGEEHSHTLASMNNVANALSGQGKYAEAEKIHRKVLELREMVLGEKHPGTLQSMNNVAGALSHQGRLVEAENMHRKTLRLRESVLGKEHPETLTSMNNVAQALSNQGKFVEAESIHRETLDLSKKVLGEEHPDTLTSMNNIAGALSDQGKFAEAAKVRRRTLKLSKTVLGEKHPDTLLGMYCLAHFLAKQLRYDDSCNLYKEACAAYNTVLGEDHPTSRACYQHYRQLLALRKQAQNSLRYEKLEGGEDLRIRKRQRSM